MPIPWLLLDSDRLQDTKVKQVAPASHQEMDGISVDYQKGDVDWKNSVWKFSNGVIVRYDLSIIHADDVVIDKLNEHAIATGHVHVDDPAGTIDSERIELWWNKKDAHSLVTKARLHIGNAQIQASSVIIKSKEWTIFDGRATTSRANPFWYEVRARKLVLHPGKNGKMYKPSLYLLGQRLVTFPDRTFNLDPRSEGIGIPSMTIKPGQGIGPSWAGGLFVDHSTDLAFSFGTFPRSLPTYGLSVTRSLLPDEQVHSLLTPGSDLGERFRESYLDSIHTETPTQEDHSMRYENKSVALDTGWNSQAVGRGNGEAYTKPLEAVYQLSGASGAFGLATTARFQEIKQVGNEYQTRAILSQSIGFPGVHLTRDLRTLMRVDGTAYVGNNQYGWVHTSFGVAYEPIKQFRAGVGVYTSTDFGHPDYVIDPLVSKQGAVFRGDLDFGPTKFSIMTKWDPTLQWFDHEFTASQIVGCFDVYIMHREFPNEYAFGLRLNFQDLADLLGSRHFVRPPAPKHVISPDANGNP